MADISSKLADIDSITLVKWIVRLVIFAVIALVIVIWQYFSHFHEDFATTQDKWGQFGDYLGGTLNPIFGFLGFIVLVLTLALQSRQLELTKIEVQNSLKELELTREELKRSSDAQELTAKALNKQAEYAVISARLTALDSALSVVTEQINQARAYQHINFNPTVYENLVHNKERLAGEINKIADQLIQE